ncbi:MAG: N-acetylmuramoyl-L-alanine amidase [Alphaproteobacteria bacterium]|jgi:N-acetylmuramoyl-L-alanine amidase
MKKIISKIIIILSLTLSTKAFSSDIVLKDIRVGTSKITTRIVLDFNKNVQYNIFNLRNPYRLVIDTTDFKTKLAPETLYQKGAIRSIRTGTFSPNVSRTVIDLKYPIKIKKVLQYKKDSKKLVIDIIKASKNEHKNQKSIKSDLWSSLERKSKIAQKKELDKISQPIKKSGKPLIILDAGHGGPDAGAIGIGGYYEKRVTLAIAQEVYKTLKATGKFNVGLTRSRDIYIPLRTRYRIAEKRQADFFISIHADKHSKSSVRGMSIYTLSNKASDREAAKLARKENAFDEMISGSSLKNEDDTKGILIDLTQNNVMNSASELTNYLIKVAKYNKIKLLRRPHRFAGFAVLKSPNIPSILIEAGYMSNKYDIKNLNNKNWRKRFANVLTKSLIQYYEKYPLQN